ncbi:hypothetical protein [Nitrosomonas sp.]|uniref:hypothetical protein n=1 Tax=Nitrosomonas sp. TaxID=42353 RepID=UPI001E14FE48|nr:hypothetical protein [Nitrosomonas sp.]MCB1949644.1 hypothetical protein [Nitrosomonas sp.]
MQDSIFVVNEEPYCLYEIDLHKRNMEFLNSIDAEYFEYILHIHTEAGDEKRASIALRASLHHAIETMFSLLGAYIQAPDCAYAWITKCSNKDLREVVRKISSYQNSLFTKLNIKNVSWINVAESVFRCYMPDTDKNKNTTQLFSNFWSRLAGEFADKNYIDKYNSIKHGFRIRAGGFALAVGVEHEYGVKPPSNEMKLIGKSDFGTTFFRMESIGKRNGNRSIRSRRVSVNWKIERTILLLQLVSMSIQNITSALKISNGAQAGTCKFSRPQGDSDFDRPWSFSPGATNCSMDFVIPEECVTPFSKQELLKMIKDQMKREPVK